MIRLPSLAVLKCFALQPPFPPPLSLRDPGCATLRSDKTHSSKARWIGFFVIGVTYISQTQASTNAIWYRWRKAMAEGKGRASIQNPVWPETPGSIIFSEKRWTRSLLPLDVARGCMPNFRLGYNYKFTKRNSTRKESKKHWFMNDGILSRKMDRQERVSAETCHGQPGKDYPPTIQMPWKWMWKKYVLDLQRKKRQSQLKHPSKSNYLFPCPRLGRASPITFHVWLVCVCQTYDELRTLGELREEFDKHRAGVWERKSSWMLSTCFLSRRMLFCLACHVPLHK